MVVYGDFFNNSTFVLVTYVPIILKTLKKAIKKIEQIPTQAEHNF